MAVSTRPPRADERFDIQAIATLAGMRFAEHDDPRISARADDLPPTLDRLETWIDSGHAWVSVDNSDEPVGFVVVDVIDGLGHIEELAVRPDQQRNGHGRALLEAVLIWCLGTGKPAVTLTTFRDVEWNRPYYKRRGFRVLLDDEVGPGLGAKVKEEADHGLDPDLRVCMRLDLD